MNYMGMVQEKNIYFVYERDIHLNGIVVPT